MKYITVPASYTIYKIKDEVYEIMSNGMMTLPPIVVLEVMALNGQAEKVATVGYEEEFTPQFDEGDEEEGGESPWIEDHD